MKSYSFNFIYDQEVVKVDAIENETEKTVSLSVENKIANQQNGTVYHLSYEGTYIKDVQGMFNNDDFVTCLAEAWEKEKQKPYKPFPQIDITFEGNIYAVTVQRYAYNRHSFVGWIAPHKTDTDPDIQIEIKGFTFNPTFEWNISRLSRIQNHEFAAILCQAVIDFIHKNPAYAIPLEL